MTFINIIFLLALAILIYKLIVVISNQYNYRKKEKQLNQLRQIYRYFQKRKISLKEAEKYRTNEMIIENGWLYTNYFFFDLTEDDSFEKIEKYLLELTEFFLTYSSNKERKVFDSIVEFKMGLNATLSV